MRALGRSLPPSPEIAGIDEKIAGLEKSLSLSMERDRTEYAAVPAWARTLVVMRGVLDRAVVKAMRSRAGKERDEACERHGVASMDTATGPFADAARNACEAALSAQADLKPLHPAVREAQHLGKFVVKEANARLVPRLPALVGLGVGWWIAQTFTDSSFSATLHEWGIGSGPTHAVSSGTLKAMNFWLPLFAAAVVSYAGSRLAAAVKRRYAAATSAAE